MQANETHEEIRVDLVDKNGFTYVGEFRGERVAQDRDVTVYRHEDGRLIVVGDEGRKYEYADCDALRGDVSDGVYIEVANAVGETPIIDL